MGEWEVVMGIWVYMSVGVNLSMWMYENVLLCTAVWVVIFVYVLMYGLFLWMKIPICQSVCWGIWVCEYFSTGCDVNEDTHV